MSTPAQRVFQPHELFAEYKKLDGVKRGQFLALVEIEGDLELFGQTWLADAKQNINRLRTRTNQLEAENIELRKRPAAKRLTAKERRERVLELSESFNAPEIVERMTADGEPISQNAVYHILSRYGPQNRLS